MKTAELSKKQMRAIDYSLNHLFRAKSLLPDFPKDLPGRDYFSRLLRLSDNRSLFLTENAISHIRIIVEIISEANIYDGLADYSDIWSAFHHIIEDLISKNERPNDAVELLELIQNQIDSRISTCTYAVPLYGIKLDGIDLMEIGSLKIVISPIIYIENNEIECRIDDVTKHIEDNKHYLWLIGSARGTRRVSQEKFRELADLATGMLAVCAASMHEGGATPFEIGIIMTPQEGHGIARWISWNDKKQLSTHCTLIGRQPFVLDRETHDELSGTTILPQAFKIFESQNRTELEKAVAKGVYWFSDAHRDKRPAMKLVKYWSCIETFFSSNDNIVRSVSTGLAMILVSGAYEFVPKKEYPSLKKRVAKLYKLRSSAVHGANYRHVSERDVSELSQWAAWMLINMIAFVEQGFTQPSQIKNITDQLNDAYEKFKEIAIQRDAAHEVRG